MTNSRAPFRIKLNRSVWDKSSVKKDLSPKKCFVWPMTGYLWLRFSPQLSIESGERQILEH